MTRPHLNHQGHKTELRHIAVPVEPHHLKLSFVNIPLLGRINVGERPVRRAA